MDTLLLTGDMRRFRQVESIVRSMSFDIDKVCIGQVAIHMFNRSY